MKQSLMNPALLILTLLLLLAGCCKEDLPQPPAKPVPNNPAPGKPAPQNPDKPGHPAPTLPSIRLKAAIQVGNHVYDSIPAQLTVLIRDSSGNNSQQNIQLAAGTSQLQLPANTASVTLTMDQWKVRDTKTYSRAQLDTLQLAILGGSKPAKRLESESGYIFAAGVYRPQRKAEYQYNSNGSLNEVRYFQKKIDEPELRHHLSDRFFYTNGKLTEIKRLDIARNLTAGGTLFGYNTAGRIATMDHNIYDVVTKASVAYHGNDVSIFYQYNNGHSLTYNMEFRNGNKVKEEGRSSRGSGEGGTFEYDHAINPYAHINYPNLYLSNLSKNNLVGRNKNYSGAFPSSEPYKYEYTYDADGYPVQLLQYFRSGENGEIQYHTKTVYTYAAN